MQEWYAIITTKKSFNYRTFEKEEDLLKFLGLNKKREVVNIYTEFQTLKVLIGFVKEEIINMKYGKLTKENFIKLKKYLLQNFNQEITTRTFKSIALSKELQEYIDKKWKNNLSVFWYNKVI